MNEQGAAGEAQAADYLTSKGYQIVARNYQAAGGEIDLVARLKKTLVFVEVKQRSYSAFGGPVAAVTKAKQLRIAKTAVQFIKTHPDISYEDIRFDVICILPKATEQIENAFCPPRTTL
ncbi:MAG: YraN family protein [Elusimicrobiaceae bacterium]|nr:YraN family protein [Elusimicrobiaceae bacterium]